MANVTKPYRVKRYGWIRDLPDHRDLVYAAPLEHLRKLPRSVDLTSLLPGAYDQGDLGSCTGNAVAGAVQFARRKAGRPDFVPSRLFIYYNERVIEGTVEEDSGAQIRDGMKVVAGQGVCPSGKPAKAAAYDWPYVIEHFRERPPKSCYDFAKDNQVVSYRRIPQVLSQLRGCLAAEFPFVFGFTVYEGFESAEVARTGIVNLPAADEAPIGGHAVLAVGYDDAAQRFLVRNSWGERWGKAGHFTMPYAYLADPQLAGDFWTVRLVE